MVVNGQSPTSRILMQLRGEVRPLRFADDVPLLCSAGSAWAGAPFEVHRVHDAEDVGESGPLDGEYGLMVVMDGSYAVTVRTPRGDLRAASRPGTVSIMAGERRPDLVRVEGNAEILAFPLLPAWLQYLSVDAGKLQHRGPIDGGPTARALAAAMREEVGSGCGAGRLYAESLTLSLFSYAFSRVPAAQSPDQADAPPLPASQQALVAGYMRERLDQNLGLSCLARLVGLSPRQFSARFRSSFGTTPHRYLTQLRVAEGARLLAGGTLEIAEIALRVGFCSQSHFTAAFRRALGVTPRRYAQGRRSIVGATH